MEIFSNIYNKLTSEENKDFLKNLGFFYLIFIVIIFFFMIFIKRLKTTEIDISNYSPVFKKKVIDRSPKVKKEYFVRTRPVFKDKEIKKPSSRFLISQLIN
tara:strand:+ start:101 stop:403 length:303 start_codon:yes stop_codon:yes gene_type:complete